MTKLREAAKIIEERGWIKGSLENDHGVCLVGAVRKAWGMSPEEIAFSDGFTRDMVSCNNVIKEQFYDRYFHLDFPYFNDHDATVEADVLLVLDKAAVLAEEVEGFE